MEDTTQHAVSDSNELFETLASERDVPAEIVQQLIVLMNRYPDLSIRGSRTDLTNDLEKIVEAAFRNKIIDEV